VTSLGLAMAQAVSCRPLTAEAWVLVRFSLCGICGVQSDTGRGFPSSYLVFSCQYHSTVILHTHIRDEPRPVGDRRSPYQHEQQHQ
jgi:hypothetical protein